MMMILKRETTKCPGILVMTISPFHHRNHSTLHRVVNSLAHDSCGDNRGDGSVGGTYETKICPILRLTRLFSFLSVV